MIIYCGTRRSGKSLYLKKLIKKAEEEGKKVIVIHQEDLDKKSLDNNQNR